MEGVWRGVYVFSSLTLETCLCLNHPFNGVITIAQAVVCSSGLTLSRRGNINLTDAEIRQYVFYNNIRQESGS